MDIFKNVTSNVTTWWGAGAGDNKEPGGEDGAPPTGDAPPPVEEDAAPPKARTPSPPTSEADTPGEAEAVPAGEDGAAGDASAISGLASGITSGISTVSEKALGTAKGIGTGIGTTAKGIGTGIGTGITGIGSTAKGLGTSVGSFLFNVTNKAGKTLSETAKHIKHSVEENSILGEFNKEQEAFLKEKQQSVEAAVPPWIGYPEEDILKQQILSLSQDRRNFVRAPPTGVEFPYEYNTIYPVAMATLAEDPNLEKMRFELVPKVIKEEDFWRNYFYRVSLIKQSTQLSSLAQESKDRGSSGDDSSKSSRQSSLDDKSKAAHPEQPNNSTTSMLSQTRQPLPVKPDEEWEHELQHELQEYEVVDSASDEINNLDWERELKQVLGDVSDGSTSSGLPSTNPSAPDSATDLLSSDDPALRLDTASDSTNAK